MSRNGPNKTVFAARNRKMAMVEETVRNTDREAQVVATEWRDNSSYDQVRVTSYKFGKFPDRSKGEKQQYRYVIRAYAK